LVAPLNAPHQQPAGGGLFLWLLPKNTNKFVRLCPFSIRHLCITQTGQQSITFQIRNTMKKLTKIQTATINGSGPGVVLQ